MRHPHPLALPPLLLALTACGVETIPNPDFDAGRIDAGEAGSGAGNGTSGTGGEAGSGGQGGGGGTAGSGGMAGTSAQAGSAGMEPEAGTDGGADAMVDAGVDAMVDAQADAAEDAALPCDGTATPSVEACLIDDSYAVFVSETTGDDASGTGTMEAPLASLGAGLARAQAQGLPRLIVCAGTYQESVHVGAAIAIHGGFACDDGNWVYDGRDTKLEPTDTSTPLTVTDVTDPVLIEDLRIYAQDATEPSASSVAMGAHRASDLTLRRVLLSAGDGQHGTDGLTEDYGPWPATGVGADTCADTNDSTTCLAGFPALGNGGGTERRFTCPAGDETVGALGGDKKPSIAEDGEDGTPSLGGGLGGSGGSTCESGGQGTRGHDGADGGGATTPGGVTGGAWQPSAGTAGEPGGAGQGGGGGGAHDPNGGGDGGGAGGCGGAAGQAGTGGGASIALLSVQSNVTIEDSTLQTGTAGDGGNGSAGQGGMDSGGIGGKGATCGGGNGGAGGDGGDGGGGAGGVSVGVLYTGSEPGQTDVDFQIGAGGAAGEGPDSSATEDDGPAGVSEDTFAADP